MQKYGKIFIFPINYTNITLFLRFYYEKRHKKNPKSELFWGFFHFQPEFGIRRAISVHNSESITTLTVTIAGDKIPKMSFGLNSI